MTAKDDALSLSEYTWNRLRERVDDLTDDEYLWSPVPDAWTVRPLQSGGVAVDFAFGGTGPDPFTTIAWRIAHLVDVYGGDRNQRWLAVAGPREPVNRGWWRASMTVDGAIALLDSAAAYWHGLLETITDEQLAEPIGPVGGSYAEASKLALVLHQLDEAIHHAAEVSLMRDLYARRGLLASSENAGSVRDEVLAAPHPVARAADLGRWDLVEELVLDGRAVNSPGRTALHQAAAVGHPEIVRLLVAHGADVDALDPDWNSNALAWARTFGSTDVIEYLEA